MDQQQVVTILMVEDDEGHARLIEKNIRRAGVKNAIMPFPTGRSALDYLGRIAAGSEMPGSAYLMLLDLNLPDMSGTDILQRIKSDERTQRMPIIVLTTTDDKVEIERCYELGCNVYITKPVNYDNFALAIQQLGLFFMVMQIPEIA